MSITELQTGPLEMKESEWSQSKKDPVGDHYPTDSSGQRWGLSPTNDPLLADTHAGLQTVPPRQRTHVYSIYSEMKVVLTQSRCGQRELGAHKLNGASKDNHMAQCPQMKRPETWNNLENPEK